MNTTQAKINYENFVSLYESLETKKEIPAISYKVSRLNKIDGSYDVFKTLVKGYPKKWKVSDAEHIIKITCISENY